jgi:hypothetical protein
MFVLHDNIVKHKNAICFETERFKVIFSEFEYKLNIEGDFINFLRVGIKI